LLAGGIGARVWLKAPRSETPFPLIATGAEGRPAEDGAPEASGFPAAGDRALAFGYLIDTPRSQETIDESLVLAEKLRLRYQIDTGNVQADRVAAARRAQEELLDVVVFSPREIEDAARSLGYSLDPRQCADACDNVRRLAIIELKKSALRAFADGHQGPGRIPSASAPTPER
jgi:hypothetical protein